MRIRRVALAAAAVTVGVLAVPATAHATVSNGPTAVGLTAAGTGLVRFDTDSPSKAGSASTISGLTGDTKLVGIDRRVQNRRLYGVGDQGGIYLLASMSKATKVGQLSVTLTGTEFGVDFNPAANALRVISDTGQNLRQPFGTDANPNGATVADTGLAYTAGTPALGLSGAGYTNNDLNADTATSLFDIDTELDQVALQAPANAGSLSPTGKLGKAATGGAGFDVYSTLQSGKTIANHGFAVLTVGGDSRLYSVDLLTGDADYEGQFAADLSDIAVALDS